MSAIYKVFVKMVVAIILGLILRKSRVIDDRAQTNLSDLLLKAILPFTVIASSQFAFTHEFVRAIAIVAVGSVVYYAVALAVLRPISRNLKKFDDQEQRIFTTASVFANTGFLGFPLMMSLLPDQGLLLAAIYNLSYNIFFYIFAADMLNISKPAKSEREGALKTLKDLLLNPVAIASVGAVVLFIIPYRFPVFINETIDMIGDMTVPLSMILLGSTLATINPKNLFTDLKMYVVVAIRMVILPAIMFGAVMLISQFYAIPATAAISLIIITALPAGTMNVIYAEKYNCAPRFAARIIVMTLLITFITVPALTQLCFNLFPVG